MRAWLVVLASFMPAVAWADGEQSDAEVAAQAATAFQRGVECKTRLLEARKHFGEAADACTELHRRGVRSPALYRNLGNAAVLADRWPEAIWAYHVGLTLNPNDPELGEHLAFVRGKTLYPASGKGQPEPEIWPVWLYRPTMFEFAAIAGVSYLFAWLSGMFAILRRTSRSYVVTTLAALLAVTSGIVFGQALDKAEADRRTPLVIVAENTPFYRGNGTSYPQHPDLPILPRGMEVRQQHRRGNWLQVRLTSGEIGWLPRNRVLIVEP
jgi:hypothetical protein